MTYSEISGMIAAVGLPYAYDHFDGSGLTDGTEMAPPFICYIYTGSDDLAADNINYQKIKQIQIELYTDNKDFALEEALETVLTAHDLFYTEAEGYLSSEQMYMHTYTTEIVITPEPEETDPEDSEV